MGSTKKFLSALAGLSLLGISTGSMAGVQFSEPAPLVEPSWQSSRQPSPMIFAQMDNPDEWHHNHPNWNPNDYNWGGSHHYNHPPGWFGPPPSGWAIERRNAYLEQRRQAAIEMQREMLAQGDMKAAQRLGTVIAQLNSELHYR
jgi:hypothetical protein